MPTPSQMGAELDVLSEKIQRINIPPTIKEAFGVAAVDKAEDIEIDTGAIVDKGNNTTCTNT